MRLSARSAAPLPGGNPRFRRKDHAKHKNIPGVNDGLTGW